MAYKNKNDFFYSVIKTQLENLKTYITDFQVIDDLDDDKNKYCVIAMDIENNGEAVLSNKILGNKLINFSVCYFERINKTKTNAKDIRIEEFKMTDLIENELLAINNIDKTLRTYEHLHHFTQAKQYILGIEKININKIWKVIPQNDYNQYYILFECEFIYQQRLY